MIAIVWTAIGFAAVTVAGVVVGKALRAHLDAVSVPAEDVPAPAVRTCRSCGCTDERACAGGCLWVSDSLLDDDWDLCTACAEWRAAADRMASTTGHPTALGAVRDLPGRLDPRARFTPSRRTRARLGWAAAGLYLLGALLYTGTQDAIAAGAR